MVTSYHVRCVDEGLARLESSLTVGVAGYNGVWALDHDDGSSYYNDTQNLLVFGGCKNYKGDHKICGPNNVILYDLATSSSFLWWKSMSCCQEIE